MGLIQFYTYKNKFKKKKKNIVGARQSEGTIKTVCIGPMAQSEDIYLSEDGQIMLLWDWQKRKR